MSETLKKRWTLPDSVIEHMFNGDAKDHSFSGFHSEAVKSLDNGKMEIDGQPNPEMLRRRDAGETYKLKVKIKLGAGFVRTSKESTFFPNPTKPGASRWTKENIIRWVEQALTKHTDNVRSTREEWETDPREMARTDTGTVIKKIKVNGLSCHVLYEDGVIASVYASNLDDASSTA